MADARLRIRGSSKSSWRHRPQSLGPLLSTAPSGPVKLKPISSDDEEQKPPLLAIVPAMDDEFTQQMEITLRWLLTDRGPTLLPPTPSRPRSRGVRSDVA